MIAERMKALRKELHLTQEQFGKMIGLSQGHLTSIESGKRNITDRTISAVCHTFHVREQWLREGKGQEYQEERDSLFEELAETYHLDPLEQIALEAFLAMPVKDRQGIMGFLNAFVERLNGAYEEQREALLEGRQAQCAARNGAEIGKEQLKRLKE